MAKGQRYVHSHSIPDSSMAVDFNKQYYTKAAAECVSPIISLQLPSKRARGRERGAERASDAERARAREGERRGA